MTNIILILLIFCAVLFFYIHIYSHLKTGDDLEIYEIENPSKDKFEEICDIRQPVIFNFNNKNLNNIFNVNNIIEKYGVFDVKVKDTLKTNTDNELNQFASEETHIPIKFKDALNVLDNQNTIIENNSDFLEETGLIKYYKYNDIFIKPYVTLLNEYDYIIGSDKYQTQLKYDISYRTYYYVSEGKIKIKLTPPKNIKYLNVIKDYENFEFYSHMDPWNIQEEYQNDFDKIKFLEVDIEQGQIIYIPAYWWYTIEFSENTSVCKFKYYSYMNYIAILPHLIIRFLQTQNVKRYIVDKIIDDSVNVNKINEINKSTEINETTEINESTEINETTKINKNNKVKNKKI